MKIWSASWIQKCLSQSPRVAAVSACSCPIRSIVSFRHSSRPSLSTITATTKPDQRPATWRFSNSFTPSYEQIACFMTCPSLLKQKKNFKYDPNYVKPPKKAKKDKKEKVGVNSITWENEQEETEVDMTKMTSAELEQSYEPMPEEQELIESFTVKSANRSGVISNDAEISLKQLVNKYPKLKHLDGTDFVKYMEFMTMHGFHPEQAAQMVVRHPPLFSNYTKQVNDSMLTWRSVGYNEKSIIAMLHYYPQLVEQPSLETRMRFGLLSSWFSRAETMFAVLNCVNVLYDHETILTKKFEFLIKNVCHTTKSIVRSLTLSYSLNHMKLRHEFLIRAGLFQKDNYYAQHKQMYMLHPRIPRNKYFPPADVVCTSDKDFLRICTNDMLTLNELAAFEELYEKELEREKLYMSDDEDEGADAKDNSDSDGEEDEDEEAELFLAPAFGANNSSAFFNKKDASDFYY